jgi:hypothetical protein
VKGIEFYSTAAQVIPILLIVIFVEFRILRGVSATRWYETTYLVFSGLVLLGFTAVAEWRALRVLQTEHVARHDSQLVWLGLTTQAAFILGFLFAQAQHDQDSPP